MQNLKNRINEIRLFLKVLFDLFLREKSDFEKKQQELRVKLKRLELKRADNLVYNLGRKKRTCVNMPSSVEPFKTVAKFRLKK